MNKWNIFFKEKIKKILEEKKEIIDIGGGLRISQKQGNWYDKKREWIKKIIDENKIQYKILDPSPKYKPDIVGDIHNLPFKDNSLEAIICISVLEHVQNPIKACQEIHRVLKPGGYCFIHAPFLFYYHAEKGYYKDYWRFTKDAWDILTVDFKQREFCSIRGATESWIKLSPLGKYKIINKVMNFLDIVFKKTKSNQVSGYHVFLVK